MPPAMPKDLWDLPLSTESPGAAEHYVLAVEKLLSANAGAEEGAGARDRGRSRLRSRSCGAPRACSSSAAP